MTRANVLPYLNYCSKRTTGSVPPVVRPLNLQRPRRTCVSDPCNHQTDIKEREYYIVVWSLKIQPPMEAMLLIQTIQRQVKTIIHNSIKTNATCEMI